MSQQKVDKYKEEKANREKRIKKEKRVRLLQRCAVSVVCLAAVVWIGYSAYSSVTRNAEKEQVVTEMDITAVNEYLSALSTEE